MVNGLVDEHTKITAPMLKEVVERFVTHPDSKKEMRQWGVLQNVIASVLMERRSILRDCPDPPENRVGIDGQNISNEDVRDAIKNGCLYELDINIYTELDPDDWWYHWA